MKESEKIQQKINALQDKKQEIIKREKDRERKTRNHELIECGALIETYFGVRDKYFTEAIMIMIKNHHDYETQIKPKLDEKATNLKVVDEAKKAERLARLKAIEITKGTPALTN